LDVFVSDQPPVSGIGDYTCPILLCRAWDRESPQVLAVGVSAGGLHAVFKIAGCNGQLPTTKVVGLRFNFSEEQTAIGLLTKALAKMFLAAL